jgi:hypothetical protein
LGMPCSGDELTYVPVDDDSAPSVSKEPARERAGGTERKFWGLLNVGEETL